VASFSTHDFLNLLRLAIPLFLAVTIEGQTAQDQDWTNAAARAKAAGRTAVKQLLTDPKYKKVTWASFNWADETPRGVSVGGSNQGQLAPIEGPGPNEQAFINDSKNHLYRGQPLNKVFSNQKSSDTNQISLDAMLTMRQVSTGDEPEVITYQLPISYNALKNSQAGALSLLLDTPPQEDDLFEPELQDCKRASNGDCLLEWNTACERPGQHALQAFLSLAEAGGSFRIKGPVMPYFSSNLFKLIPLPNAFNDLRASFYAQLPESNGIFRIEVKARFGNHLKTLAGTTTNGIINIRWDLRDEKGRKCTDDSIETFVHVKLPNSGRSQTLKQPLDKM